MTNGWRNSAWTCTPEEAYEYGKLVATQDPDGNGKNDTFLYSPYGLWADCWMIFPFLPFSLQHAASYLPDRDGEYKIKEKMDGYMPYLDFMRKMYAEGIIDPEFFTNKYYDDQTEFKQGRVAQEGCAESALLYLEGLLRGENACMNP